MSVNVTASVWFAQVYADLVVSSEKTVRQYIQDLGYTYDGDAFRLPKEGETYLTPDGKIATKEKGDKGPYGPRLIVVEALTESERTYGKGIKTGADALAQCPRSSYHALTAVGKTEADMEELRRADKWEVVEFRKLRDKETCAFIKPRDFWIHGTVNGEQNHEANAKPVYIVRPKQKRKKRVLVFDFDEVAGKTKVLYEEVKPGNSQVCVFVDISGNKVDLVGAVEEREAL